MSMEAFVMKFGEVILGLGQLTILIGIPALIIKYLIIRPILTIRREMKNGRPFWQVVREISKGDGYYNPHVIHITHTTTYKYDALRDTVGNPAYNNIPGNISYRR